jgi:hypothetical protein
MMLLALLMSMPRRQESGAAGTDDRLVGLAPDLTAVRAVRIVPDTTMT